MHPITKFKEIKEHLANYNEDAYLFDGFEKALIGYAQQSNQPIVACYDYNKCIKILMSQNKMSKEDAIEFFEFNTMGCNLGENTPVIITRP